MKRHGGGGEKRLGIGEHREESSMRDEEANLSKYFQLRGLVNDLM